MEEVDGYDVGGEEDQVGQRRGSDGTEVSCDDSTAERKERKTG